MDAGNPVGILSCLPAAAESTLPLHSKTKQFLDELKALNLPPKQTTPIAELRKNAIAKTLSDTAPTEVGSVTNRIVPGPGGELPLRIYRPKTEATFPLLVYFHGGGWAVNNLDTHDELCRKLTTETNSVVVSVDYRLAPESKFPAAVDDAAAATEWAVEHARDLQVNPHRLFIGGDSSGGNLAAVLALRFRDRGGPSLAGQILYYPATDFYEPGTESYRSFSDGYALTRADMIWFWNLYLPNKESADNPYASPLRAKDLSGLPPALIITAEYDPLVDEGHAYAARLRQAGISAQYSCYEGTIHGFLIVSTLAEDTARAVAESKAWIAKTIAAPSSLAAKE